MKQEFIKWSTKSEDTTVVFYNPIHASNIFQYSHVVGIHRNKQKDENGVETETEDHYEFLGLEFTIVEEQSFNLPLRKARKIKQTKNIEEYEIEERINLMQPVMRKITDEEEIDSILKFLESNLVN